MIQAALDKPDADDVKLFREVKKIDWGQFLQFGSIKVHIQEGKPVLVTMEKTVKPA